MAEVKQVLRVSNELVKVLVKGKYRAKLLTLDSSGRFLLASTRRPRPAAGIALKTSPCRRPCCTQRRRASEEYLALAPRLSKGVGVYHSCAADVSRFLCDLHPRQPAF